MKLLLILPFISALVMSVKTFGCTTFLLHHKDQLVFGRNYDWMADAGMVCTNQRGLIKTSATTASGNSITWTSTYGSITFNQYGKEFPTGGMNEKGLVVELMWLDGTRYPKQDQRPAIGVLQWVQYQLDNHATIAEVIESDKKLRIGESDTPLHYLVADAKGNAATIEFLDGKMVVHRDKALPFAVLTNNTYQQSLQAKEAGTSAGDNSLERFTTACELVKKAETTGEGDMVANAFSILNAVSQGSFTKWSIVYDIGRKMIHFKTDRFPQARFIRFDIFDFSCQTPSMTADINSAGTGDISGDLQKFSAALNTRTVSRALEQSASQIRVSEEEKQQVLRFPATTKCQ